MRSFHASFTVGILLLLPALTACGSNSSAESEESASDLSSTTKCTPDDPFACARKATPAWATTFEARSVDGTGNNAANPTWGATNQPLLRTKTIGYADGLSSPARPTGPNPRAVSNAVSAQSASIPNDDGVSNFIWQWGQYIDHDLDLTTAEDPAEAMNISIPAGDPQFDPQNTDDAPLAEHLCGGFGRSPTDESRHRVHRFVERLRIRSRSCDDPPRK
jgi:hypothetical protein